MTEYILWHNPRCGKSREALEILKNRGITPVIRLYLKDTPTREEILHLLNLLKTTPDQITRTKESIFTELIKPGETSLEKWVQILAEHPILIERPVLIKDTQAVIGRPPELILKLLPLN